MSSGLNAVALIPGSSPLDLGPDASNLTWSTNAIGGFGSGTVTLPGDPKVWVTRLPKLTLIRLTQDETIVFEGQVEDHEYTIGANETTVQCFGLARLLSEVSLRRIWSKRNLEFDRRADVVPDPAFSVGTGNFDPTDLTKTGIKYFGGNGTTTYAAGRRTQWRVRAPSGLTLARVMFTYDKAGSASLIASVYSSTDFTSYGAALMADATNVTGTAKDFALPANTVDVLFSAEISPDFASALTDFYKVYNLRVLGTSVTEDASGGFYGGSVLRDLIALVPGLTLGQIDPGSEFTIEAIERATRSASLDVVQEVASYYDKEWGVYENGRFDWKTIDLDKINWLIDVSELESLNLRSSVDDMSTINYVLYTDAASGNDAEASSTSTSRSNPYVRQARRRDVLTSPGFPMTTNTSAQLAARLNVASGTQPFASGSCSMRYRTSVTELPSGGAAPAYQIRAGDNIKITGLPKDDPFNTGRDGQTLFHVVSTQADSDGNVTLTLDSQSTAIDSLLARLAAVTRTLTG